MLTSLQTVHNIDKVDVVLFDHEESHFLPHLKILESRGFLRVGASVHIDNALRKKSKLETYLRHVRVGRWTTEMVGEITFYVLGLQNHEILFSKRVSASNFLNRLFLIFKIVLLGVGPKSVPGRDCDLPVRRRRPFRALDVLI